MSAPEIFSREARRVRRHHVARAKGEDRWLLDRMWDDLLDRLEPPPPGSRILIIGHDFGVIERQPWVHHCTLSRIDPGYSAHWAFDGQRQEEDQLDVEATSFDAVLACGTLDSVNDLPGALILIRRCLKPEGRLLAAMLGLGSLALLRSIVHRDEGLQAARLHPQIDVRGGGDLLARAGFAEPVADMESIEASYRNFDRLLTDLRANGIGNCLRERHPASKSQRATWLSAFEASRNADGKAIEHFCPVYLSGVAPSATANGPSIG